MDQFFGYHIRASARVRILFFFLFLIFRESSLRQWQSDYSDRAGQRHSMFWDDSDNRRTWLTLPNGIVMSYSYDNASQLTGITCKNGGTTLGTLTYAYDLAGRRTQMSGSYAQIGLPLGVSEAEYNANNQLIEWGTASLYYDPNGNMTSDGVNSFNWNARNQMSSMNSGLVSFQYDPYGPVQEKR
jgi:YD repeat-containing protein